MIMMVVVVMVVVTVVISILTAAGAVVGTSAAARGDAPSLVVHVKEACGNGNEGKLRMWLRRQLLWRRSLRGAH